MGKQATHEKRVGSEQGARRGGPPGRRALLQTALAAAAGGIAATLARTDRTEAAPGPMYYGATNNAEGWATVLKSAFFNGSNFKVETTSGASAGYGIARSLHGDARAVGEFFGNLYGVFGEADGSASSLATATGVRGEATSMDAERDAYGVFGQALDDWGTGVYGFGGAYGVRAFSGLEGTGVFGTAQRGDGVRGEATAVGIGVRAVNNDGVALRAEGRSEFAGEATFTGRVVASGAGAEFAGKGAGLTALNASSISAGTLADARLSGQVPLKNARSNAFTGALSAASLAGKGSGVTDLSAASIATGTLADARLSANIPRQNAAAVAFTGTVSAAQFTGPAGVASSFAGVGTAGIAIGKRTVVVKTPGVDAKGHVLALLQSNAGAGVGIQRIDKVAGGFKAVLTRPATRSATLAFFVVRQV
jgi:hypothetical protein